MSGNKEPALMLKNGNPNPEWITDYMNRFQCNDNKARHEWHCKIRETPEPPLANSKGGPSSHWVTWWVVNHNCTRNVALKICKGKIAGTYIPNRKTTEWLNQKKTIKMLESY